jgi:hypothetical protein
MNSLSPHHNAWSAESEKGSDNNPNYKTVLEDLARSMSNIEKTIAKDIQMREDKKEHLSQW